MAQLKQTGRTLDGKVALVTGGTRGIGAGIVQRLAEEGAAVAFTYVGSRDRAQELERAIADAGGRAQAIKADSADVADVRRAVAETAAKFGRLDILVNNAGVGRMAPIEEASMEDFDQLIAVNVRAVFVATQEALRHMGKGGRIINIGSINAESVPLPNASLYAMSKGAVASFTRGLARDLGPRGITVNNVQPGPVATDMNPDSGPFADSIRALVALKRYGQVDEVASLVAFLAGPESSYMTGASLNIDGGFGA